jgi:hypothetical protein
MAVVDNPASLIYWSVCGANCAPLPLCSKQGIVLFACNSIDTFKVSIPTLRRISGVPFALLDALNLA